MWQWATFRAIELSIDVVILLLSKGMFRKFTELKIENAIALSFNLISLYNK